MTPGFASDSRRSPWSAAALLAVLTFAAYANCLSSPFLFDDHEAIEANPTIKRLATLTDVLAPPAGGSGVTGRPIVNLSLAINHALGGTAVRGYHLFNVVVHICAGLVLFGLIRRTLLGPVLRDRYGIIALPFAWAVAALWTLHPLQTESVTCVVQRTELLAGLFYLLTLYGFVRSTDGAHSKIWMGFAIGACLLGMGSKEVMVSAPLAVFLFDRTFIAGSFRAAWAQRRTFYFGLAGTWILLGVLVAHGGGTRGEAAGFGLGVSPFTYAVKQCEAITHYLRLGLWPHPLVVDYGESLATHPVGIWIQGALLMALVAATVFCVWRRPVPGFVGMCFFAILAPSSSVVPLLTQTVAEHRMYLPLAAEIVLVVGGLERLLRPHRFAPAVACLAGVTAFAVLTARRNADYRSGVAIWQDTVAKSPGNSRAHHNLGVELAKLPGHADDAIASFRRALSCKATDITAHYSLAHMLAAKPDGRELALTHYAAALRIDARHVNAQIEYANELAKDPARVGEATAHYETAIRLKPDSSAAHYNLANLLAKLPGLMPGALAHYERAVQLRPDFIEAHFRFANCLTDVPARLAEAIAHYQSVLRLNPGHVQARYNLGVIAANHGHFDEAIRLFEQVLAIDPTRADARQNVEMLKSRSR